MKKSFKTILFLSVISIALVSCKDKAKEAETSTAEEVAEAKVEAVKYVADASASTIEWKGFKPAGTHNGVVNLESGVINMNGSDVESGSFLADMTSITVLDIPADKKGNADLVGHLKSPDFFDVENHANAAFEITGLSDAEGKTMLSGNLAIKGIKQNITFPVSVTTAEDTITLTSEAFTIDRTKWDIKYKSKSIFGDLGDKFINDDIELKINITAKKA
ncbi:YceI family protein [Hyunsoonleella ulvae]|uniref:YceI family protein n=1 Tax=Hyunsoonleella ulvae TaxID=2799948 RepID=UPI001939D0D0|nr:YceI family protein [Hyunsoonleella ulvae]